MMRCLALLSVLVLCAAAEGAPIPKSLKIKKKSYDYDGYWELTGQNMNGQASALSIGKYWKIDNDKFYYGLQSLDVGKSSSGRIITPDESTPNIKVYNDNTRCLLEIEDDQLTWIFANNKADPLDNCEPGAQRVIYYFKRVK